MLDIIVKENIPTKIHGMWQDVVIEVDKNGNEIATHTMPWQEYSAGEEIIDKLGQKWNKNTIMSINSAILAALYADLVGYNGLTYMALGNGLVVWDSQPTIDPVVITDSTLVAEFFRKTLDSVIFLDSGDNPVAFDDTVRKIESSCTYLEAEANNQAIREFALFGGNATSTLDSGLISNTIRHREIFKTSTIRLLRRVRYQL